MHYYMHYYYTWLILLWLLEAFNIESIANMTSSVSGYYEIHAVLHRYISFTK